MLIQAGPLCTLYRRNQGSQLGAKPLEPLAIRRGLGGRSGDTTVAGKPELDWRLE